jgi:hypothetical protein
MAYTCPMRVGRIALVGIAVLLLASLAAAQRGRNNALYNRRAQWATAQDFDGGFQFCRLVVRESYQGGGNSWNVDYPRADINLSIRLAELTRTHVSMDARQEPKTLLVNPGMPELFHCGFVMMTEPGSAYFTPEDAANLRKYLLQGGFIWADDFWGEYEWDFFEAQLRQVLPSAAYPIVDLPRDHPIFTQTLDATKVPQIPGIGFWDGGGGTWERSPRENVAHIRAINDEHGRVMVLLTHDTDFGDAYERETENPEYFMKFSVPGYAFGINVITYAMTH